MMIDGQTSRTKGSRSGAKFLAVGAFAALAVAPALPISASSNASTDEFSSEFAPYTGEPAPIQIEPEAVDIDEIEIPREVTPKPKPKPAPKSYGTKRDLGVVVASYYGKRFHGRLTANGERFNMNAMTAAHKKLRFGTKVRVTNVANGRSVVVRINDRGPYIRGRTIDLSRAAAARIGMIQRGHAKVKMEIVG